MQQLHFREPGSALRINRSLAMRLAAIERYELLCNGFPSANPATHFASTTVLATRLAALARYQLLCSGFPSANPAALCTPTTARSWNCSKSLAPA